jgi:hypothetical protein
MKTLNAASGRRQFLLNVLPAGTLFCIGGRALLAAPTINELQKKSEQKHKFLEDSGMTIEGILKYANETYVPIFQTLANDIGREKFLEMVKKASVENIAQVVPIMAKDLPKRDLAAFAEMITNLVDSFPNNKMLTYEISKKTDKIFEIRVTECLAAKLFREMNAEDIGYPIFCHPWCDNPISQAFNPKIRGTLPKSLMKGDNVCIARFVLEA